MSSKHKKKSIMCDSVCYTGSIMKKIESVLESNFLEYDSNCKHTELVLDRKSNCELNKDFILSIIKESIDIPKPILSLLVDVKSTKDNIYIRQRKKCISV